MLNKILQFSLNNRLLVTVFSLILLLYGIVVILKLPIDVIPDLNRPTVIVMTEAHGLAPEEVEVMVTFPIETAMNGAPGVQRVRSASGIGLSIVYVEFDWGTDIYLDRQLVNERLSMAKEQLPQGVIPTLAPISSIMGNIMLVGLQSQKDEISPMDLRSLADWVLRPRLLTIPGVSQITVIGGQVKQYQVLVDPKKLREFGITLAEVEQSVGASQTNTPGGFLEDKNQEFLVRNIGRTRSVEDIANSVVDYRKNTPILLRQLAKVKFGPRVKRGDGSVNGKPAVILSIQKQPKANTVTLTKQIESALKGIEQNLPKDVKVVELFKQSNFIETAVHNVVEAIRDGSILVILVLFIFLLNFRTTAITLTAIPLSFVVTAFFFKIFGISINTMSLGGLAVAIGQLVDDAIVGVENVFRRLKENRRKSNPLPPIQVVYNASSEVRSPIVYATLVVVLVFIPLFSLSSIEGRLFLPLGLTYIVSILASMLVSLTVTPILCYYFLPKAKVMEKGDGFFVRWLKNLDRHLLNFTLSRPGLVILVAVVLVLGAISTIPFMGKEFLPSFNEGTATINVLSVPGTSLAESNRIGSIAEQLLLLVPEVVVTGRRTGRAELDDHAEGVHYTEIEADFKRSKRSREEILGDIREHLSKIPGVVIGIGQPISHRLDHLLSGVRAQVAVKLFGSDLATLRAKAEEIRSVMATVKGVVDLQVEKQVLVPQIKIQVDREKAKKYGVRVGDLNDFLETALDGKVVSQVLDEQKNYDVLVRFEEDSRNSPEAIRKALIDTPSGVKIPLDAVAQVIEAKGPNVINRENVQRRIAVSCNVAERDLGSVITEIQDKIAKHVSLPAGYFITYGGQFESQQQATKMIGILSLFSLASIVLVLFSHFKSMRVVWQVLINIPLALIGSVIAIFLTDGILSVATMVGFITLTGIASRNTILMISHYIHLVREEGEIFDKNMIIRGSLERLVPVLMTALTAGLALIPLALSAGQPGKEILYPVATVILGGLLSSTFLDMAVTPAVFYKFGRPVVEKILKEEKTAIKST